MRRRGVGRWRARAEDEPPAVRVARAAAEVAALLRAGAGPAAAWSPQRCGAGDPAGHAGPADRAGPASPVDLALDAAARAAARGDDPASVLRSWAVPAAAAAPLAALALTWRTSETTGAPAARALERLAASLSDDAAARDAHDAALAGPRATAQLLLVLPLAGMLLGAAVGADPVGVLVGTGVGRWCAAAGSACALAGWVWSRLLVRAAAASGR